jgi:hypothetical protein
MPTVRTRLLAAAALLVAIAACGGRGFGRQYEYEEQLYLSADGSAAVVLNASVPALIALRGLALDPAPRARIDRGQVREMVSEPGLEITRVSRPWRRNGRQFIQIRAEIDDVTRLGATRLFQWSTYALTTGPEGAREYRQHVGAPAGAPPPDSGWDGRELVAFKLHLPSRIHSHNVRLLETNEPGSTERGNILTWEQHLGDRLAGKPLDIQVSMESGSILYRTLWLFGVSFGAAMALLVGIIWMVIRGGRRRRQTPVSRS